MFAKNSGIQNRLFDFIERSPDAFALFNAKDILQYCNAAFSNFFSSAPEDIQGKTFTDLATASHQQSQGFLIDGADLDGWLQHIEDVRRQKAFRLFEVVLTDGRWFLFSEQLNEQQEIFILARDITEQKMASNRVQGSNERFRQLSLTDEISGVPNRKHFIAASKAELSRCWRSGKHAALLLLEFDSIKFLNENFGHTTGDKALRHMAELIRETLRGYDIFGRVNHEQFGVFLGQCDQEPAHVIAERMRKLIENRPLKWQNRELPLTVSIGLTLQPFDTPFDQLLEEAEKALSSAKVKGRNRIEMSCTG